jgi:uncharacterized protein YraI
MKRTALLLLSALACALPALAQAEDGVTVANVNLRAGPDLQYPSIDLLAAGTPVDIQGCTEGYEWCDVIAGPDRGWVAAGYLQFLYESQPVIVQDYGPRIGLPIVAFAIGAYWDRYYRGRPFYRQRDYWYHRPFVHRPPPRPAFRHPVPYGPRPGGGHFGGPGGHRGPDHGARPPAGNWHRPPGNAPHPPGGGGQRPAQGGEHRPPQGGQPHPPSGGQRPQGGGQRPPSGGNHGGGHGGEHGGDHHH